ncbi:MAG: hypothetical protein K2O02_07140 [Lachnospiraceae bacterium]|nr:hypothetical protein [Lachnospiraceae bacterium]
MKKHIKEWGYDIFFFALIIGMIAGIWIWKNIDRTKEICQWFRSLNQENMEVVSWGKRTLASDEKKELIQLLHSISKKDIQLADMQGDIGNGSDYCIYITVDDETYRLWHTFIDMADAMISYKGYDFWIHSDELREFLEQTDE